MSRVYRPTDALDFGEEILVNSHGPWPVVVILHGGFFAQQYDIDNAQVDSLPLYFIKRGYIAYAVEYRRVGSRSGGGWPTSNQDILLALRELLNQGGIDTHRVTILGHSAGGTFALWTCCQLEERNLGFTPRLCVAIAPVADLEKGQVMGLSSSGRSIADYMKHFPCSSPSHEVTQSSCCGKVTKEQVNQATPITCQPICQYKLASPSELLPIQVPLLLCVGVNDDVIPKSYVEEFKNKVLDGPVLPTEEVKFLVIENADHFQVVNAKDKAWEKIFDCMSNM
jgi:acetyl esterase/lipase